MGRLPPTAASSHITGVRPVAINRSPSIKDTKPMPQMRAAGRFGAGSFAAITPPITPAAPITPETNPSTRWLPLRDSIIGESMFS